MFRLEIAKAPEEDIAEVEETGKWIELPMDKSNATAVAKAYGEERIEDCVYLYFESSIEQIDAQHFQDMANFDTLNALAARLKELSFADQIKFKAILEAEQPYKIGDVLDIAENLQDYELNASVASQEAFFKDYLIRHLDMRLDPSWLKSLDSGNKGRELLARLGATLTDYGIISARGRSLYEPVSLREPYTLMAENSNSSKYWVNRRYLPMTGSRLRNFPKAYINTSFERMTTASLRVWKRMSRSITAARC